MESRLVGRTPGGGEVGPRHVAALFLLALLVSQQTSATSHPVTIPFGRSWPLSIVVDSARGFAYFDATSGEYPPTGFLFGVINTTSHEVLKVLPLDVVAGPMALDQASGDVYIAGNESIEVFNGGTQSMERAIAVGRGIVSMAHDGSVSPDIFFTSGNKVFALNPQTGAIAGSAIVGNGAGGLALDPTTGRLFVAEYPTGWIFVFRASNLSPAGVIRLPSCCANRMALNTKTHTLFATTRTNLVDVVDVQNDMFVRSIQVAPSSQNSTDNVAVDNATGRVFVTSSPGGSIVELDGSTGAVVGSLIATNQVAGLAVDTRTHELYATNYHQITVFDVARGRIVFFLLAIAVVAVAISVVAVFLFVKWRDERERTKAIPGWQKSEGPGYQR